jgi:2-polyprenyl-6-methoxyphenol hydroxylase-like FAD-dependent oxidoreductase
VAECDGATWDALGLAKKSSEEMQQLTEEIFAEELDGKKLISNNSSWRQFSAVTTDKWSCGKFVLIGDALASAHFSIGSGTRLAMLDALELANAVIERPGEPLQAVARFEAAHRPVKEKWLEVARLSYSWYETFADRFALSPYEFAYNFLTRTGRVDDKRLCRSSPRFWTSLGAERNGVGAKD